MCCENLEVIVSYCRIKTSLIEKIIFALNIKEEEEMDYVLAEKLSKWRGQNKQNHRDILKLLLTVKPDEITLLL